MLTAIRLTSSPQLYSILSPSTIILEVIEICHGGLYNELIWTNNPFQYCDASNAYCYFLYSILIKNQ
jgi:hypothetical protein